MCVIICPMQRAENFTPSPATTSRGSVQHGLSASGGALGFFQLGLATDERYSLNIMSNDCDFTKLLVYLHRVPSVSAAIGKGQFENGNWWIKFSLDISHPLAWNVVQELSCVLNHVSLDERLPTVFMPVSPAPYLNGGPMKFLSWVIESKEPSFRPDIAAEWLEGRLPRPVEDPAQWELA
jgi:hypothetical protein